MGVGRYQCRIEGPVGLRSGWNLAGAAPTPWGDMQSRIKN